MMNRSKPVHKNPSPAFFGAAVFLVASLLFGGGAATPGVAYMGVIVAGLLCGVCLLFPKSGLLDLDTPWPLWFAAALVLLIPLMQLLPLPPSIWQQLPGRASETAIRQLAGATDQSFPIALAPAVNWQLTGALIILGAFAIVVARLSFDDRNRLVMVLLAVAGVEFVLGVVQFSTGGAVGDMFGNTHKGWLLGTFANRNHTSLFFACCIVMSLSLMGRRRSGFRGSASNARYVIAGAAMLLFFAAVLGTGSRTGLLLTLVALAFVGLYFLKDRAISKWVWVGSAAAALISISTLLASARGQQVVDRFASVGDDQRWTIWHNTLGLIQTYLPWGAGFGTFTGLYNRVEPVAELNAAYVNNAHNDYLELLLEAGLPGGIALIIVLALLVVAVIRGTKRLEGKARQHVLLGSGVVLLIAMHSAVDYPTRRMSMAAILFMGLGFILSQFARPSGARSIAGNVHNGDY